jgi:hypothetical protein
MEALLTLAVATWFAVALVGMLAESVGVPGLPATPPATAGGVPALPQQASAGSGSPGRALPCLI